MPVPRLLLTRDPINADRLRNLVASSSAGAIVVFEGTVRNHHRGKQVEHLEYDAYPKMVEQIFTDLLLEAAQRWELEEVAIHHRFGPLAIGEVSVIVAVSAAHRELAFEACRFLIDSVKEQAPIWKKEFGPNGSEWLEGPG